MVNKKCWGQLMTLDLHGCNKATLTNKTLLKNFVKDLCKEIDMVPFGDPMIERFGDGPLEGFSMIQFIETSSITVHLDEVWDRAFIDIFSCKVFDKQKAKIFCKNFFEAKKVRYRNIFR